MGHTRFHGHRPFDSGEELFLFNILELANCVIRLQLAKRFWRKSLKIMVIYMYIGQGQGQWQWQPIPWGQKFYTHILVSKRNAYF